jgi:NADPH2:quinone reductase
VLDLVSYLPGTFDAVLKDGGRLASPLQAAGDGPGRTNVMAAPTAENLGRLGELLSGAGLRVPITSTYPLSQAPDALVALGTTHHQGKLAIRIG